MIELPSYGSRINSCLTGPLKSLLKLAMLLTLVSVSGCAGSIIEKIVPVPQIVEKTLYHPQVLTMPKPISIQTIIATTETFEIYQEICDDTQNPDFCNVAMVCRTIEDSKIGEIYREHLLSVINSLYNAIEIYKQQDKDNGTGTKEDRNQED